MLSLGYLVIHKYMLRIHKYVLRVRSLLSRRPCRGAPISGSWRFAICAGAPAGARQFQDPGFGRAVHTPLPGRASFRILAFEAVICTSAEMISSSAAIFVNGDMSCYSEGSSSGISALPLCQNLCDVSTRELKP